MKKQTNKQTDNDNCVITSIIAVRLVHITTMRVQNLTSTNFMKGNK